MHQNAKGRSCQGCPKWPIFIRNASEDLSETEKPVEEVIGKKKKKTWNEQ